MIEDDERAPITDQELDEIRAELSGPEAIVDAHLTAELLLTELDRARAELASVRPEVRSFARLMEKKLRANDHKGGWQREDPDYLLKRLREELTELEEYGGALLAAFIRHDERRHDPAHKSTHADAIGGECADIANFALMLADNAGALKGPP